METQISIVLDGIGQLIRERDFARARGQINAIDETELSIGEKSLLDLMLTEIDLYQGIFTNTERLNSSLDYFESTNDHPNYARGKFLVGWYHIEKGELQEAREYLFESYVYFKRCRLLREQGRTLNRLAYVSFKMGECLLSLRQLHQCRDIYVALQDKENELAILINIYSIHYNHGSLSKARQVLSALRQTDTAESKYSYFLLNDAMLCAHYHDFNFAFKRIKSFTRESNSKSRIDAIYYENLGWIHLLAEEYDKALPALQEGLKISLEIAPESDLVSQIKRRMADAYFGLKQYNKARQLADEALVVSKKLNERVEIASCYRVFAQLDAVAGNDDSARDWFKQAIDIFAMIESNYDLAVCRFLAATSGLYHNGERQALLYLARDYFASEEVLPFVERIDKHLPRLNPASVQSTDEANRLIAVSPKMRKAVDMAANIARSQMSILLTGATGTGKDMLAKYIHDCSEVRGEFVDINISAIPNEMVESELFGHSRGAFTGADSDRIGLIEQAAEGTLFLNEIADASSSMQAKLLAVIENHRLRRLGENEERTVSFRLLTATNADLAQMVSEGKFRADLYHRIKNVEINLPPLCERLEDIEALIRHFIGLQGIAINGDGKALEELVEALSSRDWPGNVRELKAEIEKLAIMHDRNIAAMAEAVVIDPQSECERLADLLHRHDWNRSKVAEVLGISESGLRYRMKKFNL